MGKCKMCPRACLVDRSIICGFCGVGDRLKVAKVMLHEGEEPCLCLNGKSGAIFFSGCNLRCVYCQNKKISHGSYGKEITVARLVEIFFGLKNRGALNIDLVTPSHFVGQIKEAIVLARRQGFDLPFIYNSSGYDSVSSLKELEGLIDIYLPDFKYFDNMLGKRYSNCDNYVEVAKASIDEMYRQVGPCVFDEHGILKKGMIVRHLVLPNLVENSRRVLKFLYDKYGNDICFSIMNQYFPIDGLEKYEEINRIVSNEEYDAVIDYAWNIGIDNAYIQEEDANTCEMVPEFDLEGV